MTFQGELKTNVFLKRYTTWRVGGPAERVYRPISLADLSDYLLQTPTDESITWLGLGSNVLIRDGGIAGTVILTQSGLTQIERLSNDCVRVEAGVPCAKVARYCAKSQLVGAEFLAGIPGTLGGALRMNAGAFGSEIWSLIDAVEVIDRTGQIQHRHRDAFGLGYRTVRGLKANEWFAAGYLNLSSGDGEKSLAQIKQLLSKRNAEQPIGLPSCGSVFKNPSGHFAAALIEQMGLKGKKIGNAVVSTKHANFIVHSGDAKAQDIETLIKLIEVTVKQGVGVELEREVHILGKE